MSRDGEVIEAMMRFLGLIWEPGDVREVRIPRYNDYGNTAAGWFDDPGVLAEAAASWDGKANIFVTLNPASPDHLARVKNRIARNTKEATADSGIVARRWLLIDLDPERLSGISSTDEELAAARALAQEVDDFLRLRSWPDAIVCASGNGYHLLYPLDLPNDANSLDRVSRVLQALASRFSTEDVKLDVTVGNAARLTCLIGTRKVKGEATEERPHRRSKVIKAPAERGEPLTAEDLDRLLLEISPPAGAGTAGFAERGGFSVESLLQASNVQYRRQPPDQAGITWYHVRRCPFHDDGRDFECGVGQKLPDGNATGKCFHPEGIGKGWQEWKAALGLTRGSKVTPLFSHSSLISRLAVEWPEPPGEAAYYGLAGEVVEAILPHTEADPVALLVNLLVSFGNAVGPGPHFMVGATRHPPRDFFVLAGQTAKARKGDSWPPVHEVVTRAAPEWTEKIRSGLSTGEGLIFQVRDPVEKLQPVKEKGRIVDYDKLVVDEGVSDKRLLVIESEFGKVLKVMERPGNTLSPVVRSAWDYGELRTMTRAEPLTATHPHISLIGHITAEELERLLPDLESANGFMNRFVLVAVKRSKRLPEPDPFQGVKVVSLAEKLNAALAKASRVGVMQRTPEARALWHGIYPELSAEREGLIGALSARGEAHVLRLSMTYALLDGSAQIDVQHLAAALELWGYAERSLEYVFGDASGDPVADLILRTLEAGGEQSRTQISGVFGRHESSGRIDKALQLLLSRGKAVMEHRESGGRPIEMWRSA